MKRWLPILIVVSAAVLRLYHLDTNPPSVYWEETSLGYDAYSIAKTGNDQHGNHLPVVAFPSFGDYKPSGYFYALVPFVDVMGLNTLSVRLPSALAGILSVALVYLITKKIWNSEHALIAEALFAISPWAIQFSRGGWEVNFAMMLILLGTWLLLLSPKKAWWLPLSVLCFVASMYTYHAARLFAPLMGAIAGLLLVRSWWMERKKSKKNKLRVGMVILSILLVGGLLYPFLHNLKDPEVSSRFSQTTILTDPTPVLESNKQIFLHGNTRLARVLYHRYWFYGAAIGKAILSYVSPTFLFIRGDGELRHSMVAYGLLYHIEFFFVIVGLVQFVVKRDKWGALVVGWILVATIAPSLVLPSPHTLRFLFAAPAFSVLSAYGIWALTRNCRFNQLTPRKLIIIAVFALEFAGYLHYYYTTYPIRAASDWQYGYKELYQDLAKDKKPGEQIYVTREQGRPAMYYLFYTSYDPKTLQEKGQTWPKDQLEFLQVDEYHFVDALPTKPGLYATSPGKVDPKGTVLDTVRSLDGSVVWVVWRR